MLVCSVNFVENLSLANAVFREENPPRVGQGYPLSAFAPP